ncbi:hypothetical protein COCNU_06G002850 [Cocos nucifera]|nr:hypothetical protein COCNU_06G002850 [Cocos nucifera]
MGGGAAAPERGSKRRRGGAAGGGGVGGGATVLPSRELGQGRHHDGELARVPHVRGERLRVGAALALRSGRANKFDGKISAFPGREGGGSVELEVCLAPDTMAALLQDDEFMRYVSQDCSTL